MSASAYRKRTLSCGALLLSTAMTAAMADGREQACIAPLAYLPLDPARVGRDAHGGAALGTYERISPDGRFILRSYSGAQLGKVSLLELPLNPEGGIQAYRTPFSNEAFPVQGTWRYLVDVSGEHYRFKDILNHQMAAKPLFKGGMTGFYAAASELGAGKAAGATRSIRIRSLSWPQSADADAQGVGPLQVAEVEVRDMGTSATVVRSTGPRFICSDRAATDGTVYALPMLSVDGTEFSAVPQTPRVGQPSMRVYGVPALVGMAKGGCEVRADLGFSPSKAVFGFPDAQGHAWLTYSDLGSVYVYDPELKLSFRLDHAKDRVLASAFPGLTRDGRVIYGATWQDCDDARKCTQQAGYVVVDPYQSQSYRNYWRSRGQPAPRACVTRKDVTTVRTEFAQFHGLKD